MSSPQSTDLLFVGSYNKVNALNPQTGEIVWEKTFDKSFFKLGSGIVNLGMHEGFLIVSCFGKVYRLDPKTGETLWSTKIHGSSAQFSTCTFTSASANNNLMVSVRENEWKAD